MTDKDTYNAKELAAALGLCLDTIYRRLRHGKIRHIHLNDDSHHTVRIPREEFIRLVTGNKK